VTFADGDNGMKDKYTDPMRFGFTFDVSSQADYGLNMSVSFRTTKSWKCVLVLDAREKRKKTNSKMCWSFTKEDTKKGVKRIVNYLGVVPGPFTPLI